MNINEVMQTIPKEWWNRWCGGENGRCFCIGCVQIGNRYIMAREVLGREYDGDPEYIDERKIPKEIYDKYKITKEQWEAFMREQMLLKHHGFDVYFDMRCRDAKRELHQLIDARRKLEENWDALKEMLQLYSETGIMVFDNSADAAPPDFFQYNEIYPPQP